MLRHRRTWLTILAFSSTAAVLASCHSAGKTNGCVPLFGLAVDQPHRSTSVMADCGGDVGGDPLPTVTLTPGSSALLRISGHPPSPSPSLSVAPVGVVTVSGSTFHAEHPGVATVSISGWRCVSDTPRCGLVVVKVS